MSMSATSSSKSKAMQPEGWTEDVSLPAFITRSGYFGKSQLAGLLFIAPGTGESMIRVQADPMSISTSSMNRLVSEATRDWMEENLRPAGELDPEAYLFQAPRSEAVPVAWLEEIYALPIHEDHGLVMDAEDEL